MDTQVPIHNIPQSEVTGKDMFGDQQLKESASLLFNMRHLPLCGNTSKTTYCKVNSIYEWIFSNR